MQSWRWRFVVSLVLILLASAVVPACAAAASSGTMMWSTLYNPTANADTFTACALGGGGSLYAAGCYDVDWSTTGMGLLVKYSSSGFPLWPKAWEAPGSTYQQYWDVATDKVRDTAAVCGTRYTAADDRDWVVAKYASDGTRKWGVVYAGAGGQWDEPSRVVMDSGGNVYVAGTCVPAAGTKAIRVVKFAAATGAVLWKATYDAPRDDTPYNLAIDRNRNLYVVGRTATSATGVDAFVGKIRANGTWAWKHRANGPTHKKDEFTAVAVTKSGIVYAAGDVNYAGNSDIVVARYSAAGRRTWLRTWGSKGNHPDFAGDLGLDRSGNAFVVGVSDRATDPKFYGVVAKWNAAGARKFVHAVTAGHLTTWFEDAIVTSTGTLFATGEQLAADGGNFVAARYSSTGKKVWLKTYDSGSATSDSYRDAVASGTSGICVVGESLVTGSYAGMIGRIKR